VNRSLAAEPEEHLVGFRRFVVSLLSAGALLAAGDAAAGDMDPTPERFIVQPSNIPGGAFTCQQVAVDPELVLRGGFGPPTQYPCRPNNAAFRNLVGELGFAIAPPLVRPARSTGFGGFVLSLDVTMTSINANAATADGTKYWEQGTRGPVDSSSKAFGTRNPSPDSLLALYSLRARKGLPFGFELGTSMGHLANTSMFAIGGDLHWSLLEGFRTGALGFMPDIAVGGGVRTLVGSSKLYLTTASVDVIVSKAITLADSGRLSPFVGYQRLMIFGNSSIVDLTPNVDPLTQCGFVGPHPETGVPVRRVFGTPNAPRAWTDSQGKAAVSDSNLAAKGFTKYVKSGDGTYEKTAGTGPKKFKRK